MSEMPKNRGGAGGGGGRGGGVIDFVSEVCYLKDHSSFQKLVLSSPHDPSVFWSNNIANEFFQNAFYHPPTPEG